MAFPKLDLPPWRTTASGLLVPGNPVGGSIPAEQDHFIRTLSRWGDLTEEWGDTQEARIDNAEANILTLISSKLNKSAIQSVTVATDESTLSTAYTNLATFGPQVTIETGTVVLIILSCGLAPIGASDTALMSFEVSGATVVAANDNNSVSSGVVGVFASGARIYAATVNDGFNTFTAKYRSAIGVTAARFRRRDITIINIS